MTQENQNTKQKPATQALSAPAGSGAALIASERQRQIDVEGWTPEHDDKHNEGEMSLAAMEYAQEGFMQTKWPLVQRDRGADVLHRWPWSAMWWKPSDDPIRNLVKAGALIAAEIDRLQRLQNNED